MFPSFRFGGFAVAALALLAPVVSGCGTSNYNALMNRRLGALRAGVKFQGLYAPTDLPGTPLSIRLPFEFNTSYQANSSHDDDGAVINPDRLQPPFMKLPGLKLCYEATSVSGQETLPFYCYLAAVPARAGDADKLAAQLLSQLKAAFPNAPERWEPEDAPTPEGYNIHWRKIRVEGDQSFFVKTANQVAPVKLPGIFELWLHDADNYIVLVGWRTPKSIEGPSEAVINPIDRPPNVKPDLTGMPVKTAGTLSSSASGATP
jgi:hypothetical protein